MWYHIANRRNSNSMDLCGYFFVCFLVFFLTFHKYIRHIVLFLDTYGSCSPENPDDDTYKDVIIYVYVPLIFEKKTVKRRVANTNQRDSYYQQL